MRYRVVSDDSGHKYAIPCAKIGRWLVWMASEDADLVGDTPEWAIRIDGRFTFTDPKCEQLARPKNYDPKYCDWVAADGCMISGRPAQIHHVRNCGSARDDHRILPIAPEYHLIQFGPKTSIHALGKRKFEALYGVDLEAKIAEYRERYLLARSAPGVRRNRVG